MSSTEINPRDTNEEGADAKEVAAKQSILASSAIMALGTLFSRFSGLFRSVLLAFALGSVGVATDAYQLANTLPNMLYILLAGGVFNAVLVPQLVRALKEDPDGGTAYTNRIMTLGLLFLGAVTVLLVVAAPWVMRIFLSDKWFEPEMAEGLDSVITLARWCLPQVFFYGMFTLVGQVLNSRGVFGPMMWAPIANNVIAVGMLITYLIVFGEASESLMATGDFSQAQMATLGLGSTVGIATQLLVLLPFMKRAGYRFAPRFDFRGTGLGHTLKLGAWTVGFVLLNQIAYTVVVRLLSDGTAGGGPGQTVYANSYLIMLLPHGVITVALVTALLPRLSALASDTQFNEVGRTLASTLRTALVVTLPFAAALAVFGTDVANMLYGHGASEGTAPHYTATMALFGLALVFFTIHFFMLRGFYALEQTRTVFFIQIVVATVNIVAALVGTALAPADKAPAALAGAYALAYACGAAVSWWVLRREVGSLDSRTTLRFLVRTGLAVLIAAGVVFALGSWWGGPDGLGWDFDPSPQFSFLRTASLGLLFGILYYVGTRVMRIREVDEVVNPIKSALVRRIRG